MDNNPDSQSKKRGFLSRISAYSTAILTTTSLILIIAIALVGEKQSSSSSKINQLNKKQQQIQINLAVESKTLSNKIQSKELTLERLKQQVTQLLTKSLESNRNKALSRAKFFIQEAKYSLNIDYDFGRALRLLTAAKQLIHSINEPILETEISNNIEAITTLKSKLDVNKIITNIDIVNDEINAIPNDPQRKFIPETKSKPPKTETKHWYSNITGVLSGFKNLIIIRHHNQPISPLLSQNEIRIIKNNIGIKATEAQWALLHHQQTTFTSSIKTMTKQLKKLPKQQNTQNILKRLVDLESIKVSPIIPNFSEILATITHLQPSSTGMSL
jgi:uroporphyrin-III C-methyltransferase